MKLIKAKQLVTTTNSFGWFGAKYNLNIYRGCNFGCIYCDSRSSVYNVGNFDEVKLKDNVGGLLEKELSSKRKTGIISLGAMSDPYNPYERKYKATRTALHVINKYRFGLNITTKSDLILRDIDMFKRINQHSEVIVSLTITTMSPKITRLLEPGTPSTKERFAVIKQLSDAGLYVGITLMPLIPFLNDTWENVKGIVQEAARAGVKFIYGGFGVTQRKGQIEYMYEKFDRHFPGLKQKMIDEYNYEYSCGSKNNLYEPFRKLCKEYGIVTKMEDIVKESKEYIKERQVSLF